jgi:hypothetical protein
MAKAYGLLPSQVKEKATVYDIKVTETLVAWENKMHTESATGRPVAPKLTQEKMMAMMDKVKKDKEEQNERIKRHTVEIEPDSEKHGT